MRKQDRRKVQVSPVDLKEGQWFRYKSGDIYFKSKNGGLKKVTDDLNLARLNQGTHNIFEPKVDEKGNEYLIPSYYCQHCGRAVGTKFRVIGDDGQFSFQCDKVPDTKKGPTTDETAADQH